MTRRVFILCNHQRGFPGALVIPAQPDDISTDLKELKLLSSLGALTKVIICNVGMYGSLLIDIGYANGIISLRFFNSPESSAWRNIRVELTTELNATMTDNHPELYIGAGILIGWCALAPIVWVMTRSKDSKVDILKEKIGTLRQNFNQEQTKSQQIPHLEVSLRRAEVECITARADVALFQARILELERTANNPDFLRVSRESQRQAALSLWSAKEMCRTLVDRLADYEALQTRHQVLAAERDSMAATHQEYVAHLTTSSRAQVDDLIRNHQDLKNELRRRHQAQLRDLRRDLAAPRDEVVARREAELAEVQTTLAELQEKYDYLFERYLDRTTST